MKSSNKFDVETLDILIRRADGRVVAGIPQIALYATGSSVAAALENLERKKNILKEDIAAAGVLDPLPSEVGVTASSVFDGVGRFALKSAIVALMTLLVLGLAGALLANRIEATARGIVSADLRGGRQVWVNLENSLERMADPSNEMSEERKQKLLSNIRVMVNRYKPFIAEVALLFSGTQADR